MVSATLKHLRMKPLQYHVLLDLQVLKRGYALLLDSGSLQQEIAVNNVTFTYS